MTLLKNLLRNEEGQDLIEYSLLLAFVCLVTSALFINAGTSTSGIWSVASSRLSVASTSAS